MSNQEEIERLKLINKELIERFKNVENYYTKNLSKKNKKLIKMPKEAVDMYNIMQNNYKGE
jgi:uncharacterized protein (DUF2384 family)